MNLIYSDNISLQALAIDEKIGYPEYLEGSNVTELENDYVSVRSNIGSSLFGRDVI